MVRTLANSQRSRQGSLFHIIANLLGGAGARLAFHHIRGLQIPGTSSVFGGISMTASKYHLRRAGLMVIGSILIALISFAILTSETVQATEDDPRVVLETNLGDITIELFMEECPISAGNFMNLSKDGFYDGLIFHRVMEDFMIQGGDPTGSGAGGPGYTIPDETSALSLHHGYAAVSMANAGPNTGGSQFFIVVDETGRGYLDGHHAVFGQVVEGMDVAVAISVVPTDSSDKPLDDVIIEEVAFPDVEAPLVLLIGDLEAKEGATVRLDGSGSTDDVGIVNWTWAVPYGGTVVYLYGSIQDFKFDDEGKYNVTLTVRDAAGNTATDHVIVTVGAKDPESPGFLGIALISALGIMSIHLFRLRRR